MIDILYVLGKGSIKGDIELRFSLRSVEKHLQNAGHVWIVGECPKWLHNVNHLPFPDDRNRVPDYNIMRKISHFCEQPENPASFLFFNDDHYLLSEFTAPDFPYFYQGSLVDYVKLRGPDGYGRRSNNTLKYLQANDLPTKYFDIHTPILYSKQVFLKAVTNAVDWQDPDGFIIKSLYANSLKLEGTPSKDFKINGLPPANCQIFSTFPHVKSSVWRFLQEQFPDQSKYERTGI